MTPEKAKELLPKLIECLEPVSDTEWTNEKLYGRLNAYIAESKIKKGLAMWVLRIAAAGKLVTPGGATEILALLGKSASLTRLKKSCDNLQAME